MADEKKEGFMDKATGRAKEAAGSLTGDKGTKQQGQKEQNRGEEREELENAKEDVEEKSAEVNRRED